MSRVLNYSNEDPDQTHYTGTWAGLSQDSTEKLHVLQYRKHWFKSTDFVENKKQRQKPERALLEP